MNEKGLLWESLFLCTQGRRIYAAYVACPGAASMGEYILKPYFRNIGIRELLFPRLYVKL